MITTIPQTRPEADTGFPRLLREWRQKRRLSQLDLALSSGVSQRHVSFLESGRANFAIQLAASPEARLAAEERRNDLAAQQEQHV